MNAQIAKATLLPCPFCGGEAEVRKRGLQMNVERAKAIIRNDTISGNIFERIEALKVAQSILGDDATMGDIWRWAEHDTDTTEAVNEE